MDSIKILDRVTEASMWKRDVKEKNTLVPQPEEGLGLRFKRGQRVKDKVTGQGGEILGGTVEDVTVQGTET